MQKIIQPKFFLHGNSNTCPVNKSIESEANIRIYKVSSVLERFKKKGCNPTDVHLTNLRVLNESIRSFILYDPESRPTTTTVLRKLEVTQSNRI